MQVPIINIIFDEDLFYLHKYMHLLYFKVNNAGKAAKSGVREGFLIESINSASVDHLTSNEAQALLRNAGDTLTIGVYRFVK